MKKALLIAIVGSLAFSAQAGESWGGKEVSPMAPNCSDAGLELSAGYMTDYFLNGLHLNRSSVSVGLGYEVADGITVGVTHINGIDGLFAGPAVGINETDLYLSADVGNFGGFDVTLGYTHRFFSAGGGPTADVGEINLGLRRDIGFADLVLGTTYSLNGIVFGNGGWIHHAGLEKEIALTDSLGVVLGGGVLYHDGYFASAPGLSDWSSYYVNAALPISIGCNATITPYIGYNGTQAFNPLGFQADDLHGGISVNVSF